MSASDSRAAASATAPAGAPEGQDTGASGSAVQGTAEREALARVLDPHLDAPDMAAWERQDRWRLALHKAGLVLAAGYRRVIEDFTAEDADHVAEALHCAETGGLVHWPTVAGILADEVYRLRAAVQRGRVIEDEDTVERVARAMADTDGWGDKDRTPLSQVYDYTRLARAALQALREEQ